MLAPTLYTLWSVDLIDELLRADDTATESDVATSEMALSRAQRSDDLIERDTK